MSRRMVQRVIPVGTVTSLGGDVTGAPASNTVVRIQGRDVDAGAPNISDVLTWDGTQWTPEPSAAGAPGFGEVLYVDLATGNDATALRGRIDRKYLTIQAAVDDAATGDVIELGPGIFSEAVTVNGAVVDYLTFVGHGRSTAPGAATSGTTWEAPAGQTPLTLTNASAQVAYMSLIGDGNEALVASGGSSNAVFLFGLDCVASSFATAASLSGLGALRSFEVKFTGNVVVSNVTTSDWNGSVNTPGAGYSMTFQSGGSHVLTTGSYDNIFVTGTTSCQVNQGVSALSFNESATSGSQTVSFFGYCDGAATFRPGGTKDVSSAVFADSFTTGNAGSPYYFAAVAATFLSDINVGNNVSLDLTRAKYNTGSVMLGTGATATYTDHTNDDQHGARGPYKIDGSTLLHPIVTVSDPGFMSSAMLTTLNSVAALTSTAPVNVGNVAAAVGVGTTAARHDHQHDVNFGTAVELTDSTNASGSATTLALSDHTHAHGNRGGGSLHAVADSVNAGFMSAAKFNELTTTTATANAAVPQTRTVTAGSGLTGGGALTSNITINVGANADGSIVVNADDVQVGILATDAQHGARGGGTQHAAVTSLANGFATPTMLAATQRTVIRTPGAYPYTIDATDLVILVDSSSARTIQLPNPATYTGICWIKDAVGSSSTNVITLARFNTEAIDGVSTDATLTGGYAKWGVVSNGTNWYLL